MTSLSSSTPSHGSFSQLWETMLLSLQNSPRLGDVYPILREEVATYGSAFADMFALLESERNRANQEFEEFQKDSSLLEGELEDALRDAEVRAEKAQGQLRRCTEDLSRERETSKKNSDRQADMIRQLENEKEDLLVKLTSASEKCRTLELQVDDLESRLRIREASVVDLQNLLDSQVAKTISVQASLDEAEDRHAEEIHSLQDSLDGLRDEIQQLRYERRPIEVQESKHEALVSPSPSVKNTSHDSNENQETDNSTPTTSSVNPMREGRRSPVDRPPSVNSKESIRLVGRVLNVLKDLNTQLSRCQTTMNQLATSASSVS